MQRLKVKKTISKQKLSSIYQFANIYLAHFQLITVAEKRIPSIKTTGFAQLM